MENPLYGIGPVHAADPCAKASVGQAVAKPAYGIGHHQHWVGRMKCQHRVRDGVAEGGHDGHAATAQRDVDASVCARREGVAQERGEEDEGDDGVGKVVVLFELVSLV